MAKLIVAFFTGLSAGVCLVVVSILLFIFLTDIARTTKATRWYDVHGKPIYCKPIRIGDHVFNSVCEEKTAHLR